MLLTPQATIMVMSKLEPHQQRRVLDGLVALIPSSKREEAITLLGQLMFQFGICPSENIRACRIDTLEYFKLSCSFGLSRPPQCRIKSSGHSREVDLFHEWHTGMWCKLGPVPVVNLRDVSSVLISHYAYTMLGIALSSAESHLPPELQAIIVKFLVVG